MILASSAVVRDIGQKIVGAARGGGRLARYGKFVTAFVGLVAIPFALWEPPQLFWFMLFAWSGLGGAFVPVVLCSLFWKRTTLPGALAGMATGFAVTVAWVVLFKESYYDLYELIPGLIAGNRGDGARQPADRGRPRGRRRSSRTCIPSCGAVSDWTSVAPPGCRLAGPARLARCMLDAYASLVLAVLVGLRWRCRRRPKNFSYYLPDAGDPAAYDAGLYPVPSTVLGYEVGEWHVRPDQLNAYVRAVAASSPRVSVSVQGRTHEQRRQLLLAITSPAQPGPAG